MPCQMPVHANHITEQFYITSKRTVGSVHCDKKPWKLRHRIGAILSPNLPHEETWSQCEHRNCRLGDRCTETLVKKHHQPINALFSLHLISSSSQIAKKRRPATLNNAKAHPKPFLAASTTAVVATRAKLDKFARMARNLFLCLCMCLYVFRAVAKVPLARTQFVGKNMYCRRSAHQLHRLDTSKNQTNCRLLEDLTLHALNRCSHHYTLPAHTRHGACAWNRTRTRTRLRISTWH